MSNVLPPETYCRLERGTEGQVLYLDGDWTLARLPELQAGLKALGIDPVQPLRLDAGGLGRLDSAAANHLLGHLEGLGIPYPHLQLAGFSDQGLALLGPTPEGNPYITWATGPKSAKQDEPVAREAGGGV